MSRRLLLLGLILLLALALRAYHLGKPSLWLDEILTVQLSTGRGYWHLDLPQDRLIQPPGDLVSLSDAPPAWKIWTTLERDVHPPLYYLLLRGWRWVSGDGDAAIRALSVTLSLGAITLLYLAVQPQFGVAPALWACLLMALAGPQIEYAQENRSYMLLLACLLAAAAGLVRAELIGPGKWQVLLVGAGVLGALLTHYAAVPVILAMLIFACVRLRGRARTECIGVMMLALAIFLVLWGPFAWEQARGFAGRISFSAEGDHSILAIVRSLLELPLRLFTSATIRPAWIGIISAVSFILPALMLRRRPAMLLWWLWLCGYAMAMAGTDVLRSAHTLQITRYTLPAAPAAFVIVAALLSTARGWRRHVVPATLALACVAALPGAYVRDKADWRAMARFFSSSATGNDVMLIQSGGEDDWRARCMYVCLRFYAALPPMPLALVSQPSPELIARMDGRAIWLLQGQQAGSMHLPGWQPAGMWADPLAGRITHLRPVDRGIQP